MSNIHPLRELDRQSLTFADFKLCVQTRRLLKNGVAQRIGERAFDLLCVLTAPPQQRHQADALRQTVWGASEVSENNLRVQIAGLRKLIGREAISFQIAKGYRFELPVLRGDAAGGGAESEPAAVARLGNLPQDLPRLWGRDAMLEALAASVAETRLITLKGVGGAGKTAIALACAERCANSFPDGVWWVDLAPLAGGALVLGAVASVLNRVLPEAQPLTALGSTLASRRLLLVLDNCEHVAPAVAELCDHLLRAAPAVHLLCTSRVPLKAAGERVWPVGSLDLPEDASLAAARHSGAVALFEARAKAADGRFRLTAANLASVGEICRHLDGLAFALVLAAARVPVLGVNGVLQRLDERLSWAQREGQEPGARHLTLQATLDWSHALLTPSEQLVLRRLGVFAGSFSLDAVLHLVTDDGLNTSALLKALQGLVDHSLLVIEAPAPSDGREAAPRYTMHESVRLHARQRLQESQEQERLRDAHAAYYAIVARQLRRDTQRRHHAAPAVYADLDNLREALAWSTEHRPMQAMALCADSTFTFRKLGHHAEARRNIARLLAMPSAPEQLLARVDLLNGLCSIDFELEAVDAVMANANTLLRLLEGQHEPTRRAHALSWLATAHLSRGAMATAESLYRQALAECRSARDPLGIRDALINVGYILQTMGRHDEARRHLVEAVALHDQAEDEYGMLACNENLGQVELGAGRPAEAALHHEAAVLTARRIRHLYRLAHNLKYLALARRHLGQTRQALSCLAESLQISQQQHFERLQAEACIVLAGTLRHVGQHQRALTLTRAARRLYERARLTPLPMMEADLADTEKLARSMLDAYAQHMAFAHGDTLRMDEAARWAQACGPASTLS